jgi:hypothetical protein
MGSLKDEMCLDRSLGFEVDRVLSSRSFIYQKSIEQNKQRMNKSPCSYGTLSLDSRHATTWKEEVLLTNLPVISYNQQRLSLRSEDLANAVKMLKL